MPADGTGAAYWKSGDFGTSPFFGSASDQQLLVRIFKLGSRTTGTIGNKKLSVRARSGANQSKHRGRNEHVGDFYSAVKWNFPTKAQFGQFGVGLPGYRIIVVPQLAERPPGSHIYNTSQKLSD